MTVAFPQTGSAGEGASSNYFPGGYGDFGVALEPATGFTYVNFSLLYEAEVEAAVLQGRANASVDTFAYINMSALLYAFEEPVLGAKFAVGGFVPIGYADINASVTGQRGSFSATDSTTSLGDIAIIPASLHWNAGNWNFNLYELITTPTGDYDVNDSVNLGRNYWSYDTIIAGTNLNMETGREYSFAMGYLHNSRNDDTDYRTGNEFHVDLMFNQFLSDNFAVGVHGYYYKQLNGDSGSGAILGDFEGESYGIGPSLLWSPAASKGRFTMTANWLHDLNATNRLESNYGVISLVWQLGAGY